MSNSSTGNGDEVGETFLFSSESVDKICDQVSDAILDEYLKLDPNSKVACETFTKTGMILIGGEISSRATIDFQSVIRRVIERIGYDDSPIEQQSPDIAQCVHEGKSMEELGAGDQGLMFGYATDETEECMPLTIVLAHALNERLAICRRDGTLPWARPDSKSQVTVEYKKENGACVPLRVHTVVISIQHDQYVSLERLRSETTVPSTISIHLVASLLVVLNLMLALLGERSLSTRTEAGELMVGELSQLSYAIGIAEPLAVYVDSYGTGKMPDSELLRIVNENFDLRPGVIIKELDLQLPIFQKTAAYGHFGRKEFSWEKPKLLRIYPRDELDN
ncbi:S-adenosylmethionine synthase isoform type-2 [Taenia crassiceps]|uniref:methionine adenosyltransferase n=1 Tax=Taenia crassiceps TaxID=6207 RepID=A0ABR4QA08_9CEST